MEELINPWDVRAKPQVLQKTKVVPAQENFLRKLKRNLDSDSVSKTKLALHSDLITEQDRQPLRAILSDNFTDLVVDTKQQSHMYKLPLPSESHVNVSISPRLDVHTSVPSFSPNYCTSKPKRYSIEPSVLADPSSNPCTLQSDDQSMARDNKLSSIPKILSTNTANFKPDLPKRGSFLNKSVSIPNQTCPVLDVFSKSATDKFRTDTTNLIDGSPEKEHEPVDDVPQSTNEPPLPYKSGTSTSWTKYGKSRRAANLPCQNFVKLNLKQKCFSRKGSQRQRLLKKKCYQAKLKKKFGSNKYNTKSKVCFKCGVSGHWANKCPSTLMQTSSVPETSENALYSHKLVGMKPKLYCLEELDNRYLPATFEDFFDFHGCSIQSGSSYFSNMSLDAVRQEALCNLNRIGFKSFRIGQELVILRILLGISTLVVMPTAAGKSLCFQLPALMFQQATKSVALVISPLISLMQDQVLQLLTGVNGAFLNSTQSMEDKKEILSNAHNGQYSFLMVSPEALVESDWLLHPGRLPPISFVCIDEAHCLADWSHHFRPSYLRVCNLLRKHLGVSCFLGLSATCTPDTIVNICKNLGIENPSRLIGDQIDKSTLTSPGYVQPLLTPLPTHLTISASMDSNRDEALLGLLTRAPFNQLTGGILIYCATREQTERLASFIRTALQELVDKVGRRTLTWTTAAYHAGLSSTERARIQKKFMGGKIRVLIATSAFGMGLNKPDLQAVIHYSLTKSFENFVQEIGRVGRMEQASYCHSFLPPALATDPREANDLRRHIFANHIDAIMLKRLLKYIFGNIKCTCRSQNSCLGHVHAIDPTQIADEIDIKPESLATILAYLELDPNGPLISILQSGYAKASIDCYSGPTELAYASHRSLAVAGTLSLLDPDQLNSSMRQLCLDLPALCNRWGWKPYTIRQELKSLEWDSSKAGPDNPSVKTYRTGISVNLTDWNLWIWIHGSALPITSERLDACITYLTDRLNKIESAGLDSLERLMLALGSAAEPTFDRVYVQQTKSNSPSKPRCPSKTGMHLSPNEERDNRSLVIHELIKSHFLNSEPDICDSILSSFQNQSTKFHWPPPISENQINSLRATIRDFLRVHEPSLSGHLTGRVIANILHGISTPQFPSTTWSRCRRYWRTHLDIDWPQIKDIATDELMTYMARI